jgi:hypothetical protein
MNRHHMDSKAMTINGQKKTGRHIGAPFSLLPAIYREVQGG